MVYINKTINSATPNKVFVSWYVFVEKQNYLFVSTQNTKDKQ